jgi:RimJ/RimL family protein N-acetyltransferase
MLSDVDAAAGVSSGLTGRPTRAPPLPEQRSAKPTEDRTTPMEIRPATPADLAFLDEIDGTVESERYVHVDRTAAGPDDADGPPPAAAVGWRLEPRPLREKLVLPNRIADDLAFVTKQIVTGADDGAAWVACLREDEPVAIAVAQPRPQYGTLALLDVRVDYDYRRQGLGQALGYAIIQAGRDRELRAVVAETLTNNDPAQQYLAKLGFQLSGMDVRRHTNHDLVKEQATLFWYLEIGE